MGRCVDCTADNGAQLAMPRIRTRTVDTVHYQLGQCVDTWNDPTSRLRDYALSEGPEHLWSANHQNEAQSWLTQPGFLAERVQSIGRFQALEMWRALGEADCVRRLLDGLADEGAAELTAAQWVGLGDFLRLGQHRRAAIDTLEMAQANHLFDGLEHARVLRSLAAAIWESSTTISDVESALAHIDEALEILGETPNQHDERLALRAYRATIAA